MAAEGQVYMCSNCQKFLSHNLNEVQKHMEACGTKPDNQPSCDEVANSSIFLWSKSATLFLLDCVKEAEEDFENPHKKRKQVWISIANKMEQNGWKMSWEQCDSKWKGMKKTYKKIIDHNNTSGNGRKTWEYLQNMDEILKTRPEITPISVCSSDNSASEVDSLLSSEEPNQPETSTSRKRNRDDTERRYTKKTREDDVNRRQRNY